MAMCVVSFLVYNGRNVPQVFFCSGSQKTLALARKTGGVKLDSPL